MTNTISKNLRLIVIIALTAVSSTGVILFFANSAVAQVDLSAPANQTEAYTGDLEDNPIIGWIQFFVNLLAVVIIAGSIVMAAFAGLQYTSARDNAQTVQAAKEKMFNILLGLVAFFFLYGFIQWLIPGGVF